MRKQLNESFKWSLTFTKKVICLVTILWFIQLIFSAIMIWYSVKTTGTFNYLDTFITDNGESFRLIVGANTISKTVENVFKYNEGGIFGKSINYDSNSVNETDSEE